jgi:hypothetical protein
MVRLAHRYEARVWKVLISTKEQSKRRPLADAGRAPIWIACLDVDVLDASSSS